jgi:alpha-tubulin suppressor-like RCC1 family protein
MHSQASLRMVGIVARNAIADRAGRVGHVRRQSLVARRVSRLLPVAFCVLSTLLPSSVLASGSSHSLIVKSDGTVWAVGDNANGQLGDNTTTPRATFAQVAGLSNVTKVATGAQHSMALTSTGALYVWGDNAFGQVGDGTVIDRKTPVLLSLTGVTAIAAGEYHSVALKSNGDAYAWGRNVNGQLGKGNTTQGNAPAVIIKKISGIAAGFSHTLFLKNDGTVVAAGLNTDGQLGDGTTTQRTAPVAMTGVSGATAVSGGARHSVVLLSTGALVATGNNDDGQLGNGTTTSRTTVGAVSTVTGMSSLVTGAAHSVARKSDGTVWTWGRNHAGQVGDGTITNRSTPAQVAELPAATTLYAGEHNAFAVTSTGIVYGWGVNAAAQLGDGTTVNRWSPVQVSDASFAWRVATPALTVGSGTYHLDQLVVVTNATSGATIHYTQNGIDPTPSDPTIASGSSIALSHSQTLKAKAFKTGMPASAVATAVYVLQVGTPTFSPLGGTYTSAQNVAVSTISPGATLRYTTDGSDPTPASPLYTSAVTVATSSTLKAVGFKSGWSNSEVGVAEYAMNFGTMAAPVVEPATGSYVTSTTVTMSAAQSGATIRYTTDDTPPTAGSQVYTAPISITATATIRAKSFHPDYTASPEIARIYTITAATPVIDVASGAYESGSMVTVSTTEAGAVIRMSIDGTEPTLASPVVASGTSLLIGNFTLKARAFKAGVSESTVASATYTLTGPLGPGDVAAGGQHSVLVTTDGRVYSWGANGNGQLGDDSLATRLAPAVLNTITGVTQISAGASHTLARLWTGEVYAWGSNGSGRLGDGTTTPRTRPTLVPALANIEAVAAGGSHSLALASDGRVYAWGANSNGQLGLGSTISTSVPTEVAGLSNVIAIAAGSEQSFAVTSTGQLYAWGSNTNSRLGDGGTTGRLSPVLVDLSNVISVASGLAHGVALTSDGSVFAWGLGSSGQLGTGTTATLSSPTVIPGLRATAVAAGSNFTAAVRHDGVLVAWGANAAGQVGDSTTVSRTSPVAVAGPPSVSTIALGDSHTLIVTPEGATWTWGAGAAGRLGDSTIANRATPQSVLSGLANWRLAAPTVSISSGSFNSPFDVTLASTTVGAAIHYTLTGSLPTEADSEVPPNGTVSISASSMLRARAFLSGRPSSVAARATYQLQAAAPIIDPPTGFYLSAQTVSISSADPSSTLRYTDDGTNPNASSTPYTSSFVVSSSKTIKARAFSTSGLEDSEITSVTLSFEVAPPIASPPGGVFNAPPMVALSSPNGQSIHFTLDGTTPTANSAAYAEPISIPPSGATLKSVAFHPGFALSSVRTDVYAIDSTTPTITAQIVPAPINAWSRTPVIINFHCFDNIDVASCSAPAALSSEGAGQIVTGTAVDSAGNQTQLPLTLNLDFVPPTLSISSPPNNFVTTSTTLAVSGLVADSLSGLASVTCNGVTASVVNGAVSCSVTLRPGRNVVAIAARDVAGNSASAAVTVTLSGTVTQLTMAPEHLTMVVGESTTVTVRDNFGVAPVSPTWGSTNPSVISLTAGNPPILTALSVGTSTVYAQKSGLTAAVSVTVVAGETLPSGEVRLPAGTTRWNINTITSTVSRRTAPIYTRRISADGPDLFTVEPNFTTNEYTVRALTADGAVLWKEAAPGVPLMGDHLGAAIAGVPSEYRCAAYFGEETFCYKAFVRFGASQTANPWRYDSAGYLDRPAIGLDGTIYAIEHIGGSRRGFAGFPDWGNNKSVVILDGATGQLKARVSLPPETSRNACGLTEMEPMTLGPIVGADGNAYLLAHRSDEVRSGPCSSSTLVSSFRSWSLLRISPSGLVSGQAIDECPGSCAGVTPDQLMPDGVGGIVINARVGNARRLVRFDEDFARSDYVIPFTRIDLVGQGGTVFLQTGNGTNPSETTQAFNLRTGSTIWSATPGYRLVDAATDNGAVAQASTGELLRINAIGQSEGSIVGTPVVDPVQILGTWIGNGTGSLKSVSGPFAAATRFNATRVNVSSSSSEPRGFGDDLGGSGQRKPGVGIFVKSHAVPEWSGGVFPRALQHTSIRVTPTFPKYWDPLLPPLYLLDVRIDEFENPFFTIGAGTGTGDTLTLCIGSATLTKGINRDRDVNAAPVNLEPMPISLLEEIRLVNDLIAHFNGYKNDLAYACYPEENPGKYNSNSFTSGLLLKAGAPMPEFVWRGWTAPGFGIPVPPTKFDP